MGWISSLIGDAASRQAVDYTVLSLAEPGEGNQIAADQHYLRVWLRSARIVNVREWTSKFHPAVHARFTYTDRGAGMREVAATVAPGTAFEELDPANLDRFITINRPLLGPIPYRGQIGMEVALFSVKSADLAKPYLDFLLNLSETAGVSLLSALQPFAAPIRQGAELLFKNKNYSQLEIGLDKTDTLLRVGNIIAARVPKGASGFDGLRLDPSDWKLVHAGGAPVTEFPYMVLGVEKVDPA
ncbi:MAG: hypothetical protein HC850_03085 [Rhodomicrobium sp.]|nr:hypothetical protein [Rhodomicrobium sp.]